MKCYLQNPPIAKLLKYCKGLVELFLVGTYSQAYTGLKKRVICIFCINVMAFGIVFYSRYVLGHCIVNGYATKKLQGLSCNDCWLFERSSWSPV